MNSRKARKLKSCKVCLETEAGFFFFFAANAVKDKQKCSRIFCRRLVQLHNFTRSLMKN